MYFGRINRLKARLAKDPLTDREVLPYLIAYGVTCAVAFLLPAPAPNRWDVLTGLSGVFYSALGPIYVYRKNGGAGGSHFLQRFLTLGWVTTIRTVAAYLPVFFVAHFFVGMIAGIVEDTRPYNFILFLGLQTVLYLRMGHHIEEVHRQADRQPLGILQEQT